MNGMALKGSVLALVLLAGIAFGGCSGGRSTGSAGAGGQCRVNADCVGGKLCVSGVCVVPPLVAEGDACVASRDCAATLYCNERAVCAKGGNGTEGQACTTDGQCVAPLRCALDGFLGVCAPSGTGEPGRACQTHQDCLSGLWCGRDQLCQPLGTAYPPFAGVACADEGAFRAYFEVPRPQRTPADFFRLPFPNDARVSAGRLNITDFPKPGVSLLGIDLVQLYVDAWVADFDGFSAIAPVTFRFSSPIDFATATGESVRYVDLTPGATLGNEIARAWSFNAPASKYLCRNRLVVRNSTDAPLLPKHTYAVLLTTAIRSTKGDAPAADPDLAALLAATRPTTDAALGQAWDAYQPLRDWLASKGAAAPAVASAAVFTVQDTTGPAQRVADSVARQPAPVLSALTLCDAGVKSPCDDGTAGRACVAASPKFYEIHGKLRMPIYQQGTPPYEKPEQGGGIVETAGVPQVARSEDVCFALSIPKGAAAPSAGWPLVVHHHGTGGSMRSIVTDGLAEALAGGASPAAVLGFDAVEHGARRGASTKSPEQLVFNLLNPRAARDNYLQGAADVVQALRVAGVGIDASASPIGSAIAFNPAAVAFFGHEQGSASGELALPFTDAAPAVVLSGAGAFVTMSLLNRKSPSDLAAGLALVVGEPLDDVHPVMTLLQSYFDRSDPLHTNPLLVSRPAGTHASKHVFMSWGVGDTYTPKSTLEANARSLRLPAIRPLIEAADLLLVSRPLSLNVTGGDGKMRTAAVFQYMPSGYRGYDGNLVALREPAAITDWSAFLQSGFATGTPVVP